MKTSDFLYLRLSMLAPGRAIADTEQIGRPYLPGAGHDV